MANDEKLFYGIGEVSEILQLKAYVLRYWETEFKKLNPQKSFTGQRTYRVRDIQVALTIKKLLYDDKYTIAGAVQKLDELDSKGELVAFPTGSAAPALAPVEVTSHPVVAPDAAPIETQTNKPKVDTQKVKDLKSLVEATKKLLKKYNLS
jgi:DNA-binding transcriptional MerR regulator